MIFLVTSFFGLVHGTSLDHAIVITDRGFLSNTFMWGKKFTGLSGHPWSPIP